MNREDRRFAQRLAKKRGFKNLGRCPVCCLPITYADDPCVSSTVTPVRSIMARHKTCDLADAPTIDLDDFRLNPDGTMSTPKDPYCK